MRGLSMQPAKENRKRATKEHTKEEMTLDEKLFTFNRSSQSLVKRKMHFELAVKI